MALHNSAQILRKPRELEKIEVLEHTELTADIRDAFVKLWRSRLRHVYTDNRFSGEYSHDLVVTRFCDAVVVVPYYRNKDGKIIVVLRRGTRPAVYLRHLHTKTAETVHQPVFRELVAGGVEESDYTETEGIRNRATKEVFEEAGFPVLSSQLVELGSSTFTAPGFAIEKLHFFCVEIDFASRRTDIAADDPHEEVGELEFREIADALAMCRTGKIADQKTEVALFRFASQMKVIPEYGLSGSSQKPE